MTTPILIALLTVFCLLMFSVVVWLCTRQRKALKLNQERISNLQEMLKKQYQHRVESIGVIVSAMIDKQCDYTEGCIRLKQLVEQVEPEVLNTEPFTVIQLMFDETEHMPIKEQWKQLEKKAKNKFTQQRLALEAKHGEAIHAAVTGLRQHEFKGYQSLA